MARICATCRRLGRRGVVALEVALVGMLLVIFIAGVVDIGQAVFTKAELYQAVRAAQQYAVLHPDDTSGIMAAASDATTLTHMTVNTPVTSCECSDGAAISCTGTCATGLTMAKYLTVSTSYALTAQYAIYWTGSRTLSVQAKFRVS